jgi:inhibitor of KinA sporulation pathway (predicted exonuclease)
MARDPFILVIDVEATCWPGAAPPGEQSEIIEIGVCLVDPVAGARRESESILVRPERSRVSPFCTELTTLTQELVDTGIPFEDACRRLREHYGSGERIWASYGAYDRSQFRRQCAAFGVKYPFGDEHLNVKALLPVVLGWAVPVGMSRALRNLRLPLEGTHHRGGDDARNIAVLLGRLLERHTVEELLALQPVS